MCFVGFMNSDITFVNVSYPSKISAITNKHLHIPQIGDAGNWMGCGITAKTLDITEIFIQWFGNEETKDNQEGDLKDFCRKHVERLEELGEVAFKFDRG